MVVGFLYARKRDIDETFKKTANKLLIDFFVSATILNSTFSLPTGLKERRIAFILVIVTVVMVITYIVGEIATHLIPCNAKQRPAISVLIGNGNNILIGLPLAQAILGEEAVFYMAISTIPFSILLYTYSVWRLQAAQEKKYDLHKVLSAPSVFAILSLALLVMDIPTPGVVEEFVGTVSAATLPLSMLLTGATLGQSGLLAAFKNPKAYLVNLFRLIINPIVVWLIMRLFISDPILLGVSVIIAGTPGAIMVTALSLEYGCDAQICSESILVGTILSIVTIPILMFSII